MFEPENELGVIVLFAQQCEEVGFEILSIQSAFPDALVRRGDVEYRVEFELLSSNFYKHRHDPRKADLIICWQNDKDCVLPVLALSEQEWRQKEIVLPSQTERELDYWKHRALDAERLTKQLQKAIPVKKVMLNSDGEEYTCPYCGTSAGKTGKPFANAQAVSAHLRGCDAYQAQKVLVEV